MSLLAMRPFLVIVVVAILVAVSIAWVFHLSRGGGPFLYGVAGAMVVAGLLALHLGTRPKDERAPPVRLSTADQYVTSGACRSCHPGEYDTWHKTYHRTMTRAARASDV